jgi:hypothetical protein
MEKNLQNTEIGVAEFRLFDALRCVGGKRLKGFHENQPDMDAGGILLLGEAFAFH